MLVARKIAETHIILAKILEQIVPILRIYAMNFNSDFITFNVQNSQNPHYFSPKY
jgi:hypothetical protein